jgi:hypothetical protein
MPLPRPCEPPNDLSAEIKFTKFEKCCNGSPRTLFGFEGSFSGDLGHCQFDQPLLGIPFLGTLNLTEGFAGDVSFSISGEEDCNSTDVCGNVSLSGSLNFGLSLTAAADILRLQAVVEGGGISATGKWCSQSGFSAEVCVDGVDIVVSAELGSFVTYEIRWELIDKHCGSL